MSSEEELPCDVTRVDTRSFDDFPLEIIALIADFVYNFDDLARMSLVSHHVRNGVLLSYRWIIVREVVEAMGGDVEAERWYLHDRLSCTQFACAKGLLRLLRVLNLSRTEVLRSRVGHTISRYGRLDVLKYLCTTYALAVDEVVTLDTDPGTFSTPVCPVVVYGHFELLKYLHSCGMTIPTTALLSACERGRFEILKWLHTDVGFTTDDVRRLRMGPLLKAARRGCRDCVVYLRTGYGLTQDDARRVLRVLQVSPSEDVRLLSEVFDLD